MIATVHVSKDHKEIRRFLRDHSIVRIRFVKKNGDLRVIVGTLDEGLIPNDMMPKGTANVNYAEAIPVFDIHKGEWRSFKPQNLVDIEGIDGGVLNKDGVLV